MHYAVYSGKLKVRITVRPPIAQTMQDYTLCLKKQPRCFSCNYSRTNGIVSEIWVFVMCGIYSKLRKLT